MFEVYLTTNNINKKIYIGQHRLNARGRSKYLGSGKTFLKALKKYGSENFDKVTLCRCATQEEVDFYEKFFIKMFNARNKNIGYNIAEGGEVHPAAGYWRGKKRSPDVVEKLNAGKIAKYGNSSPAKGSRRSPEQRQRQSQRQLGKKCGPYIQVDLVQLKELRLAGETHKKIAEKLGISIRTVRDRLNKTF